MDVNLTVSLPAMEQKLDTLLSLVRSLGSQGVTMAAKLTDLTAVLAGLTADVTAEKTTEDSVVVLLNGLTAQDATLQAQLTTALANGDPTAIQAALDQITANRTAIQANTATMAAAVASQGGTPPPPPPPPGP